MRLRDLDASPVFNAHKGGFSRSPGDSIEGMQGIQFQCPKCSEGLERGEEDGRRFVRGAHYVLILFSNPRGVEQAPADAHLRHDGTPNPFWTMTGSTIDDLTLQPSINCDIPWKDKDGVEHQSSCKWHGWVTNGDAAMRKTAFYCRCGARRVGAERVSHRCAEPPLEKNLLDQCVDGLKSQAQHERDQHARGDRVTLSDQGANVEGQK